MDQPISPKSGSIDLRLERAFNLGGGHIDPQALQYATKAKTFRLQPQTLKVLVALHDKIGQAVTRDELIDRCRDGRIVGDDVINRCISLLRPLAAASGHFTIDTIPRSGYRLIEDPISARRRIFGWRTGGLFLVLLAVIAAAILYTRAATTIRRRPLVVRVMPFTAQPDATSERLAAEAQDSVVRILTESGLSVQLAISGRSAERDAADLVVSGELSADARGATATVRLEDPGRHAILLLHRLNASAATASDLPDRIGANVASALSWTGPLILLDEQHPSDPAFVAQLLDQASSTDWNSLAEFEFSQRNAPNAPDSAIAQLTFALDTGFALVDIPREQRASVVAAALRAADRARQLAPEFGDTYISACSLHSPTLIRTCEDSLRAGLAKDAQAPFVSLYLSELMNNAGRTQDAASLARASLAEDRYVPEKIGLVILLDETFGRPEAGQLYKDAVRLWPNWSAFFWRRAEGFLQRGDFNALEKFEREVGKDDFPRDYNSAAAINKALSAHSMRALTAACPKTAQGIQAIQCMIASNLLGDLDDAFFFAATLYPRLYARTPAQADAIWLEHPYQQDTVYLTAPATANMRRDPRFLALVDGLGLLDYWRGGRMPDFCTQEHETVCARIGAR
jgi:DNA-binding winged helix-turn-helix (wHTH) protein